MALTTPTNTEIILPLGQTAQAAPRTKNARAPDPKARNATQPDAPQPATGAILEPGAATQPDATSTPAKRIETPVRDAAAPDATDGEDVLMDGAGDAEAPNDDNGTVLGTQTSMYPSQRNIQSNQNPLNLTIRDIAAPENLKRNRDQVGGERDPEDHERRLPPPLPSSDFTFQPGPNGDPEPTEARRLAGREIPKSGRRSAATADNVLPAPHAPTPPQDPSVGLHFSTQFDTSRIPRMILRKHQMMAGLTADLVAGWNNEIVNSPHSVFIIPTFASITDSNMFDMLTELRGVLAANLPSSPFTIIPPSPPSATPRNVDKPIAMLVVGLREEDAGTLTSRHLLTTNNRQNTFYAVPTTPQIPNLVGYWVGFMAPPDDQGREEIRNVFLNVVRDPRLPIGEWLRDRTISPTWIIQTLDLAPFWFTKGKGKKALAWRVSVTSPVPGDELLHDIFLRKFRTSTFTSTRTQQGVWTDEKALSCNYCKNPIHPSADCPVKELIPKHVTDAKGAEGSRDAARRQQQDSRGSSKGSRGRPHQRRERR